MEQIMEDAMGNTSDFISDDFTIQVRGIGGPQTTFGVIDGDFNANASLIARHHCVRVGILMNFPDVSVDLTKMNDARDVTSLLISLQGENSSLIFDEGTQKIFDQLVFFQFRGIFPKKFPSIKGMRHVKKLEIEYDKSHTDWMQHEGIIDLIVHGYDGADLRPLAAMKSLQRLCLVDSSLKTLNGIETIPDLQTLHIAKASKLSDLRALTKAHKVENILFENYSRVKDWSFLADMPQIRYLGLKEVDSTDFLAALPKLVFFNCEKLAGKSFPAKELDRIQNALLEKAPPGQRDEKLPFYTVLVDA